MLDHITEGGEPTKGQAAGAIRTLALNGFNRLYINKEKGVHALCAALYEKSSRLQTQVVGALWNLTHEKRCVEAQFAMALTLNLNLTHDPGPRSFVSWGSTMWL